MSLIFFFFSSRRRHTRCSRDWSSDVCSSDLSNAFKHTFEGGIRVTLRGDAEQVELSVQDSGVGIPQAELPHILDRKSTRLNSSHGYISYAVFCLKKKKNDITQNNNTLIHKTI